MEIISILEEYNFWGGKQVECGYLRARYLQNIISYLNNSLIKVILGQRRAGKSYFLRMIIYYLQHELHIAPQNILYLNKDIHDFSFIQNQTILIETIHQYQQHLKPEGKIYLLLDEIQEIEGWEKAINSLSQDYTQQYEIFITGSNANLLSSDLATYLGGRYVEFTLYPFGYAEYLDFKKVERKKESFLTYLQTGGIPEVYRLNDKNTQENYISALKDSIVLRDVIRRHAIRDVYLLEKTVDFLIDSIGSLFSISSICNSLKSVGCKTNYETMGNYLGFLQNAFFIHECERFDIKGKQILTGERKYYLNDLAFKYFLTSSFDTGITRFLENAIFLDLKRKGYTVYVGTMDKKEINFIAEKEGERIYIQVAYLLSTPEITQREFGNLAAVPDHYPKYVITLDDVNLGNQQGIMHKQAWEFVE